MKLWSDIWFFQLRRKSWDHAIWNTLKIINCGWVKTSFSRQYYQLLLSKWSEFYFFSFIFKNLFFPLDLLYKWLICFIINPFYSACDLESIQKEDATLKFLLLFLCSFLFIISCTTSEYGPFNLTVHFTQGSLKWFTYSSIDQVTKLRKCMALYQYKYLLVVI